MLSEPVICAYDFTVIISSKKNLFVFSKWLTANKLALNLDKTNCNKIYNK